jgi:integrase
MGQQRFTAGRVQEFRHPIKGQTFYWDSVTQGLGIRATPTAKVYIFQGRLNGKTIRIKIGDVNTWLIDSADEKKPGARQEARRLQSLTDKGVDPRIEKQERLEQQEAKKAESSRHDLILSDAWSVYLEARKPRWSERHYIDHINITHSGGKKKKLGGGKTKPAALAALMPLKLSELTPETIRDWATKEAARRPTQTRLAFSLLRAFANWCEDHSEYRGLCDLTAFSGRIKKETIPKQQAKHDTLQREQLKAWFSAVAEIANPVISAYLQALLLTGARRAELLDLRWRDIDFKWQSITIGDKVEETRTIPLTPYVADLLNRLPRFNAWVFSSPRSQSGRLQEPRIAHNQALAIAGIEHLSIHGLRRSFGTLSEWLESPVGIVYQIQGHKPSATAEKHYRNRPLDLLRKWHVKIEEWILEQAGIDYPNNLSHPHHLKLVEAKGGG